MFFLMTTSPVERRPTRREQPGSSLTLTST
jgi:hypothetical protein